MQIRAAHDADVPQLLALVRRYWEFEGLGGCDAPRLERLLQQLTGPQPPGQVWVAADGAHLRGYLVVVYLLSLEHQGVMAEIDEFFVEPGLRSGGVGSALLDAAEAFLKQRGCVRLQLQLGEHNAAARRLYARRGFAPRTGYRLLDKPL